jgi:PleD family two-component response regulator
LCEKPTSITASTQRTAATAVDCLGFLFDSAKVAKRLDVSTAKILVVDDDVISRRAITQALSKAKLKSTAVENPTVGFQLLAKDAFDLIFLDVDMPGMNGYELCTKLRAVSRHKATPVVFVTGLNGFEARASSMMSGGNDFIAKPFHSMELAVKAIIHILRGKIATPK